MCDLVKVFSFVESVDGCLPLVHHRATRADPVVIADGQELARGLERSKSD